MKALEKKILREFKQFVKDHQFVQRNKTLLNFERKIDGGSQDLFCNIIYWIGQYQGFFGISNRIDDVENVLWKYLPDINVNMIDNIMETTNISMYYVNEKKELPLNEYGRITIIDSDEGVKSFCSFMENNFEEKILPIAKKYNDLKYVESCIRKALNGYIDFSLENLEKNLFSFINRVGFEFRILIIAKLVGVDDYEQIYQNLLNECNRLANKDEFFKNYPVVMQSLYEDLKQVESKA